MRKGFFLTESEKNRISDLYGGNKTFLFEEEAPLTDPDDIKKFQKWMDDNFADWAESIKNPARKYKVVPSTGYGRFGPQTKKAWNDPEKGGVYRDEQGLSTAGSNVSITQKKEWYYWNGYSQSRAMTIDEMKKSISDGTINADTLVYRQGLPGWIKASNAPDLDVPPSVNSKTPDLSNEMFKQTKIERPKPTQQSNDKTPEDLTHRQLNTKGFVTWAEKTLNTKFDEDNVVIDKNMAVVTLNDGSKRHYYYDDKNQEWSIPDFSSNITITRPENKTNQSDLNTTPPQK